MPHSLFTAGFPLTLRLLAPSGYCHNQEAAARGVARLRAAGHNIQCTDVIQRRWQRFAGDDASRLADINQLAHGPLPDIALAVRGGYGATRLLPQIDYPALKAHLQQRPFVLCGHSDFTALQMALLRHCDLVSFSGPMLAGNFGAQTVSSFTCQHFWNLITQPEYELTWSTPAADFQGEGTLWGGNIAMLTSLVGTTWLPAIKDGILVIEDVNEHPFRIERMLLQLHHAGLLAQQKAIVAGSFTGAELSEYDNGYHLGEVWEMITALTGVPVIPGLAFGHDSDTVTLPLGAKGQLSVQQGKALLHLSGYPWLRPTGA